MAWDSPARKIDIKVNVNGVEYLANSMTHINIYDAMCSESALKIGGVFSAKCEVKLKNTTLIPANAMVVPYCKEGEEVFVQLGVFNIDNRLEEGDMLNITCYDALYSAGKQYFPTVIFPATKMQVLDDICTQLGIAKYGNVILSEDIIKEAPRYESTMREVLSDIAKSAGACIHMSRDNKMQFLYFPTNSTYTIYKKDYSDLQILNDVRTYNNVIINLDSDNEIISGIKNLRTAMVLDLTWATQEIADRIRTSLMGLNYTPCRIVWRGNPDLEIGSRVSIEKKDGTFIETLLLENQYSFTGGLLQTSSAPSDTEQESEFGGFSIKREVLKHDENLNKIDSVLDIEDEYTGLHYDPEEGGVNIRLDELGFDVEVLDPITGLPISSIALDESGFDVEVFDPTTDLPISSMTLDESGLTISGQFLGEDGITLESFEAQISEAGLVIKDDLGNVVKAPNIFVSTEQPDPIKGADGDLWVVV